MVTSAETDHDRDDVPRSAWLVDLDGTLAIRRNRGPYQWNYVGEDGPNLSVVIAVQALSAHPAISAIIAITGREETARRQTVLWLDAQNVPFDELLMRSQGDMRPDEVVKEEMYQRQIVSRFKVLGVFDDRDRVVAMWRRLGLTCFQVADGNF